jgi:hypothetical protein
MINESMKRMKKKEKIMGEIEVHEKNEEEWYRKKVTYDENVAIKKNGRMKKGQGVRISIKKETR